MVNFFFMFFFSRNLLKKNESSEATLNLETCLTANVSLCSITENYRFVVAVYNPLERPVTEYCRLPVPVGSYIVTGPDGCFFFIEFL